MRHAGLPWELGGGGGGGGLSPKRTRPWSSTTCSSRIIVETDGKLMTGRDVAVAALLGAEEYGFATAPLVTLGCVMMRVCNLDTCPVGIATNNPEPPEEVHAASRSTSSTSCTFIAQELREIMASLGFKTVNEMVGRSDLLETGYRRKASWKAKEPGSVRRAV